MPRLSQILAHEHGYCDNLFAQAENAVADKQWPTAQTYFDTFHQATQTHFRNEEDILFPAFEGQTGMGGGPTYVMRMEHAQMRDLFTAMQQALDKRDAQTYLGLSESLLMLMQQHNIKEERILYPMLDQALAHETEALLSQLHPAEALMAE